MEVMLKMHLKYTAQNFVCGGGGTIHTHCRIIFWDTWPM